MASVILVREPASEVDLPVRKTALALRKSVCRPSGKPSCRLLGHELDAPGSSLTHLDAFLPVGRSADIDCAVGILEYVVHELVVALGRELPARDTVVVYSGADLVGCYRSDILGYRHPEVRRHGYLEGAEQMDILGHPRVARLYGDLSVRYLVFDIYARLEAVVRTALDGKDGGSQARVDGEAPRGCVFIFSMGRNFMSVVGVMIAIITFDRRLFFGIDKRPFNGGERLRLEVVVKIFAAEPDYLGRRRMPLEIDAGTPVLDSGIVSCDIVVQICLVVASFRTVILI